MSLLKDIQLLANETVGVIEHVMSTELALTDRSSIYPSEILALVVFTLLFNVQVVIESGTGNGWSAQFLGRILLYSRIAFGRTPVKALYTIDWTQEIPLEIRARVERMNVTLVQGDGVVEVPRIIRQHIEQDIGVFVDGPKGIAAIFTCWRAFQLSTKVKFCAIHDVAPFWGYDITACLENWQRVALLTYRLDWRNRFAYLDQLYPREFDDFREFEGTTYRELKDKFGSGLAVLLGRLPGLEWTQVDNAVEHLYQEFTLHGFASEKNKSQDSG